MIRYCPKCNAVDAASVSLLADADLFANLIHHFETPVDAKYLGYIASMVYCKDDTREACPLTTRFRSCNEYRDLLCVPSNFIYSGVFDGSTLDLRARIEENLLDFLARQYIEWMDVKSIWDLYVVLRAGKEIHVKPWFVERIAKNTTRLDLVFVNMFTRYFFSQDNFRYYPWRKHLDNIFSHKKVGSAPMNDIQHQLFLHDKHYANSVHKDKPSKYSDKFVIKYGCVICNASPDNIDGLTDTDKLTILGDLF